MRRQGRCAPTPAPPTLPQRDSTFAKPSLSGGKLTASAVELYFLLLGEKDNSMAPLMAFEKKLIELFVDPTTHMPRHKETHVDVYPFGFRSIDDELARNVDNDIPFFASAVNM